jgi:hypothetical protein
MKLWLAVLGIAAICYVVLLPLAVAFGSWVDQERQLEYNIALPL